MKKIIILFIGILLFYSKIEAQITKSNDLTYDKEKFTNYSWINEYHNFKVTFENDICIITNNDTISYKGIYTFSDKTLKLSNKTFQVNIGLEDETYFWIEEKRIIVLHLNKD